MASALISRNRQASPLQLPLTAPVAQHRMRAVRSALSRDSSRRPRRCTGGRPAPGWWMLFGVLCLLLHADAGFVVGALATPLVRSSCAPSEPDAIIRTR